MKEKKYIIIAPHPDDALIGCMSLFEKGLVKKVVYIENNPERMKQARRFCKDMKAKCEILLGTEEIYELIVDSNDIILLPSLQDNHPLHKTVSRIGFDMFIKVGFYSIDMNTEYTRVLPLHLQKLKQGLLDKYYPSQKSLWEYNWKYFLFEGIVEVIR